MSMHPLATVGLALLMLTAMPVVAAGEAGTVDDQDGPTAGSQLAADISAHQSNVETAVDDRAFDVALNKSDDPAAVIEQRISTLEERLIALEAEYNQFNASDHHPQTMKTATELETQRQNLKHLINRTKMAVEADDINSDAIDKIDQLEANASALEGTEVADVARTTPFPPGLGISDRLPAPPGDHPGNASPDPGPPDGSDDRPADPPGSSAPADELSSAVIGTFGLMTEQLLDN